MIYPDAIYHTDMFFFHDAVRDWISDSRLQQNRQPHILYTKRSGWKDTAVQN